MAGLQFHVPNIGTQLSIQLNLFVVSVYDIVVMAACRSCALQAAQLLNWQVVRCVDGEGRLRSIQSIHEEIWSLAEPLL